MHNSLWKFVSKEASNLSGKNIPFPFQYAFMLHQSYLSLGPETTVVVYDGDHCIIRSYRLGCDFQIDS